MCPNCVASAATLIAGASSIGGLLAFAVARHGRANTPERAQPESKAGEDDDVAENRNQG